MVGLARMFGALISAVGLSTSAWAQSTSACVFSPDELKAALGHLPKAGTLSTDRLGMAVCHYVGQDSPNRQFSVRWVRPCSVKAFERHAKLMQSTSGKPNKALSGIGDSAYVGAGGTAAALGGGQCVEFSGLRTGAKRVVRDEEVSALLGLALTRVATAAESPKP